MNNTKFKQKSSIRSKIMVPFMAVISVIIVTVLVIYTVLMYRNTMALSQQMLLRDQKIIAYNFESIQTELETLFSIAPYFNHLSRSSFEKMLNYNEYYPLFNWKKLQLFINSSQTKMGSTALYQQLFRRPAPLKAYMYSQFQEFRFLFLGSFIPKLKRFKSPVVFEWQLSDVTLDYVQELIDSEFALVFYSDNKELAHLELLTVSPLIQDSVELQLAIKEVLGQKKEFDSKPFSYKLGSQTYLFSYQQTPWLSDLYTVVVTPIYSVWESNLRMIFVFFLILAIIGSFIYVIYALIIRKLTSSIEIISSVSKKVAEGDLDQHVYLDNDDEIGNLSNSFNQMIFNLKAYAENIKDEVYRSQAIISAIPECIIVTDLDNRLILANEKAELMFNFSGNQLKGKAILKHINNDEFRAAINVQKTDGSVSKEITIKHDDQEERIYSLTSSYVENQYGKLLGIITVLRDLTHERQIDLLRDGFLRTVSHELRTPLTSVIGFIEIVMTDLKTKEKKSNQNYLETALKEAKLLKNLIDDLLDLSQLKAGKSNMIISDISIKELVDSLIVSMKPLTKGKSLKLLANEISKDTLIKGDYSKVRRIFLNIISNAIKFTKKGDIIVSCNETEHYVAISVSDTGIGIRQSEKEIIFEKFRQIDYSSRREYDGIGLGLSIVKELVEMHKGTIKIESEYGKGSTFTVSFPSLKEQMMISDIA